MHEKIIEYIEILTGRPCHQHDSYNKLILGKDLELGHSQFNEILILLGQERVNEEFFRFLANEGDPKVNPTIHTLEDLWSGIERFLKIALLFFGNIQTCYRTISKDFERLEQIQKGLEPFDVSLFKRRHEPILKITKIPSLDTFYLGYIIQSEIEIALAKDPNDSEAIKEKAKQVEIVKIGIANQEAYLASDHMDVYVATSMRAKHEFVNVSKITDELFNDESLRDLKIRYFDPTQAYCLDRIDKGISEGLMLKRAQCTIYLAQESETLGKDSELASTLAQGKIVIAYVPIGERSYVDNLVSGLEAMDSSKSKRDVIIQQLMVFKPTLAWTNPKILTATDETLLAELYKIVEEYYNKRADTLSKTHPLGLQVNLDNGVANGVLVVRTIKDCAQLLRNVLTWQLELRVERKDTPPIGAYWLLKEKISNCVVRAITPNKSLTNSFWSYYYQTS